MAPARSDTVRRALIEIAGRRQKPGTGSRLELLRRRTALRRWPDLRSVLDGIPWAVAGDVATRNYMPERLTQDLDIVIRADDAEETAGRLREAGYGYLQPLAVGGGSWRSPDGVELDVLFASEEWLIEGVEAAAHTPDPQGLPTLPLAHLAMMKLQSSRVQDVADLSRMLGAASDEDLIAVRELVAQVEPDALDDIESLIKLGRMEYEQPE